MRDPLHEALACCEAAEHESDPFVYARLLERVFCVAEKIHERRLRRSAELCTRTGTCDDASVNPVLRHMYLEHAHDANILAEMANEVANAFEDAANAALSRAMCAGANNASVSTDTRRPRRRMHAERNARRIIHEAIQDQDQDRGGG